MACWTAGPGSVLFIGMILRSQPSAVVAFLMPGVMYAEHVGTSHSSQANTFLSGFLVSGLVTPMPPSAFRYLSTVALAAASAPPPAGAAVVTAAAAVVTAAAAVVTAAAGAFVVAAAAAGAAVVDELLLLLPHPAATTAPHASTASRERNLVMHSPLVVRHRRTRPPRAVEVVY